MKSPQNKYKVVVLGNINVGKTSIVTHYMMGNFYPSYKPTVGIDFMSKTLYMEDTIVRMQIWDSAGQERFRSLIPGYIRDSSVAIVVYDVTDRESFEELLYWVELVKKERDLAMVVVGNKIDLCDQRVVKFDEGKAYAQENDAIFFETSAKDGQQIEKLFNEIAKTLLKACPVNNPQVENTSVLELKPIPIGSSSQCNCRC